MKDPKGPVKPYKTVEELSKKHKVSVDFIKKQVKLGTKVELEHTSDRSSAKITALQHIDEIPDYYTRLKSVEKTSKKIKEETSYASLPDWEGPISSNQDKRFCPKCRKNESQMECKYGPKFWSLYSTPLEIATSQMKSDISNLHTTNESTFYEDHKEIDSGKKKDEEGYMARIELDKMERSINILRKVIKKPDTQIPAWVQSKITRSADFIDTAAEYLSSDEEVMESKLTIESKKRGLWANIHAKRKRGERPAKPGEKGYPKTLDIEESLKKARKNVGASKCWDGYKATGTKIKNGKEVPDCKKEDVTIEDANGNPYIDFIDIIKPNPLKPSKGIDSNLIDETSFSINSQAHKTAQKREKIRTLANRGIGGEKDVAKAKLGPTPELIKLADSVELKSFTKFMEAVDKSKMKCNSPKSDPVGDSLTGKSHVVKACEGGKEKIIRFGQRGVKGSPKKKGESKKYAARRNAFKDRHAKNISKGRMSAAYWANKVKW